MGVTELIAQGTACTKASTNPHRPIPCATGFFIIGIAGAEIKVKSLSNWNTDLWSKTQVSFSFIRSSDTKYSLPSSSAKCETITVKIIHHAHRTDIPESNAKPKLKGTIFIKTKGKENAITIQEDSSLPEKSSSNNRCLPHCLGHHP